MNSPPVLTGGVGGGQQIHQIRVIRVQKDIMKTKRLSKIAKIASIAAASLITLSACSNFSLRSPIVVGSNNSSNRAAQNQSAEQGNASGETTRVSAPAAPTVGPTPTAISSAERAQFDSEEAVLVNLYERVNPAVVSIAIEQQVQTRQGSVERQAGAGSGFVIDTEGHIVTNNHVVEGADSLIVRFSDGTTERAEIVGRDPDSDLALIKVNRPADQLVPVPLGDSDALKPGMRVIAIGNPFGLEGTMTLGIVSAVGRMMPGGTNYTNPDIIQTDAAINPGNSGGPLLNSKGEVVGVNTAIRTGNDTTTGQLSNSGVGFVVPVSTVKLVVAAIKAEGRVRYPYLGLGGGVAIVGVADELNLPVTQGVLLQRIIEGGPSEQAGLRGGTRQQVIEGQQIFTGGDIITAFNGRPVKDYEDLIATLIKTSKVGDTVTLTVWRGDQQIEVQVTLAERPR
jgi:2-alkenal reductase